MKINNSPVYIAPLIVWNPMTGHMDEDFTLKSPDLTDGIWKSIKLKLYHYLTKSNITIGYNDRNRFIFIGNTRIFVDAVYVPNEQNKIARGIYYRLRIFDDSTPEMDDITSSGDLIDTLIYYIKFHTGEFNVIKDCDLELHEVKKIADLKVFEQTLNNNCHGKFTVIYKNEFRDAHSSMVFYVISINGLSGITSSGLKSNQANNDLACTITWDATKYYCNIRILDMDGILLIVNQIPLSEIYNTMESLIYILKLI